MQTIKIDTRLPATTGSVSTTAGVVLTYAVTDPTPGSGVAGLRVLQGLGTPTASFLDGRLGHGHAAGHLLGGRVLGRRRRRQHDDAAPQRSATRWPMFTTFPPAIINTTVCRVQHGLNLGTATATDDCGGAVTVDQQRARAGSRWGSRS